MKYFLTLFLSAFFASVSLSQNVTIGGAFPTTSPTSCTNTSLSIGGTNYCANYTYTGTTVTISNDTVYLDINYTVGLICLPSIVSWTQTVSVGTLFPQTYHIYATTYLNGILQDVLSTPTFTVTTTGCCPAVAQIDLNADPICFGDTLAMQSVGAGVTSQEWYIDGFLYSYDTIAFQPANVSGPFDIELIVTDGTCSDTISQTVNVQQLPAIDLGADTIICDGEVLVKTISNSFSVYNWSDGSTNNTGSIASIGSLSVVVEDAFGCIGGDTIQLLSITPLANLSAGADVQICGGDSVEVTASSTTNGATFEWSNGSQNASTFIQTAGNYYVTVSASGYCDQQDTLVLSTFATVPVVITPDSSKCAPRSVSVNQDYTSYSWNNGSAATTIELGQSDTVSINVVDINGCSQSQSLAVEVYDVQNVFLGNDTIICEETAFVMASNVQGTYVWNTGQTTSTIAVFVEDAYWLQVTDSNGCVSSDTINLTVKVCVGIDEFGSKTSFGIYPNPTNHLLNVTSSESGNYSIIDMLGNVVLQFELQAGKSALFLDKLSNGAYIIQNQKTHDTK
jgi:hypothetical protein